MKKYIILLICFLPISANSGKSEDLYKPTEHRLEKKLDKLNNELEHLKNLVNYEIR